jgi:hypothetical protein
MLQISELKLYISFFSLFFFLVLLDNLYGLAIYWLLGLSFIGYWLLVSAALCLCGFFYQKGEKLALFFPFQIST